MQGRWKVLISTLVGVAILLTGLAAMARTNSPAANRTFTAKFDNVVGLVNNSQVLHRGVRIGEITDIEAGDAGGRTATLTITLDENAQIVPKKDATVVLRLKSILGELFIDLNPGDSDTPLDGGELSLKRTHRDTSLDQILFQGAALYNDVTSAQQTKEVVDQVKALAERSSDDIAAVSENSRVIVDGLTSRVGTVTNIISNIDALTAMTEGRAGQLGTAIEDLNRTLANLRGMLERNNEKIKSLLTTLNRLSVETDLTKVDAQMAKIPDYVAEVDRLLLFMRNFLQKRVPLWSTFIAFPYNAAETFYSSVRETARYNPFLTQVLLSILEPYLAGK